MDCSLFSAEPRKKKGKEEAQPHNLSRDRSAHKLPFSDDNHWLIPENYWRHMADVPSSYPLSVKMTRTYSEESDGSIAAVKKPH